MIDFWNKDKNAPLAEIDIIFGQTDHHVYTKEA